MQSVRSTDDECELHTRAHSRTQACFAATWGSTRLLNTTQMRLHVMCFQGVWSMEGQQPGSGEAGRRGRQRRPGSSPRSRLPAHHPPAGEAADPADHHREPDQEIRHSPPSLRHSGRYSRARRASKPSRFHTFSNVFWDIHTWGPSSNVC